ncbi:MAG: hypothetical protein PHQ28_17315 [Mycobacterium sp.]|nr:hypothetical protein [Mycobacterium sp.]
MTNEPANELTCDNLIERYLRTRGSRYFRGQHDGDYFYVANTRPRRLHVHLEVCPAHHDVVIIRIVPGCFCPVADRPWLTHFAERWNQEDREVTAIVHGSCDPQRIGVVARRSQWVRRNVSFEEFACFADRAIADAIEFFADLSPVVEWPAQHQAPLRDAG